MHPDAESKFKQGLYAKLLTSFDEDRLEQMSDPRVDALTGQVDPEEQHVAIAQFLERVLVSSFATFRGRDAADRQRRLADRLIQTVADELGDGWAERFRLADPLQRLLAVHGDADHTIVHPDTPLSHSAMLTGTRLDPSLASQLRKEIASADRVDILCSFILWSGLRLVLDALRELTKHPTLDGTPRLRVITTSYMGATNPKAVEALSALPNTEVRVSYDTKRTRLHAKAYLIHRQTGFGSAYVGSANLSHAALSEGLEWTPKISQYELPHLWDKIVGTFETYWNDDEFEAYSEATAAKLQQAIARESKSTSNGATGFVGFDIHPYPYQSEILDIFAAEREVQNKHRHLLVAATGTGKTMVAAFDYKRWKAAQGGKPRLLFIAHREEILRQALGTYRAVLRDQNFGDLLVGGHEPAQRDHLFCSIQSFNSRGLTDLEPDHFDYVVVDEFHHAEAPSYQTLMQHVQPKVLLGMTATPERSDNMDVFHWFGGEASAEIRLPDAISRRLLCPFQYFGVADSENLDGLSWRRTGYDVRELDRIYTGNDARAGLVLDKVHEILLDPLQARGLGFCVSVAHAEFMTRFFNDKGIPSATLSSESTAEERQTAKSRLIDGQINFLFVVDLYNEGVDIPEVDAVLLLRPTESLTVYLQQLGRGLRLHDNKECLTVIDFIGAQRREFRFASRFRALSTEPTVSLAREVEHGFPHMPAGCAVQLERVAQQRVLENIKQSLSMRRPQLIGELRDLGRYRGHAPTLQEACDYLQTDLDWLLKRGMWSRLLHEAGQGEEPIGPDEQILAKGIHRLSHIDDPMQIQFLRNWLDQPNSVVMDTVAERRLTMLFLVLFGGQNETSSLDDSIARLRRNPMACRDLAAMLRHRLTHAKVQTHAIDTLRFGPLAVHGSYTRDEILAGLGYWTMEKRQRFSEGCLHLSETKVDAFFITLHKTEEDYSPTTMYEDYAVSDQLFHWQSQSTTSSTSPTGRRYIEHRDQGYAPLLFVREHGKRMSGITAPYCFLGSASYVSHEGSKPMSILWHLDRPMPARLLRTTARQVSV